MASDSHSVSSTAPCLSKPRPPTNRSFSVVYVHIVRIVRNHLISCVFADGWALRTLPVCVCRRRYRPHLRFLAIAAVRDTDYFRGRCRRSGRCRPRTICRAGNPNDPGPRSAFFVELDVDSNLAQEGRSTTEATGQRPGSCRPGLGLGDPLTNLPGKGAQKIRSRSRPLRLRIHQGTNCRADRVGLDDAVDCVVTVSGIGPPERSLFPNRGLAGCRPQGKIGHTRKSLQLCLGNHPYFVSD